MMDIFAIGSKGFKGKAPPDTAFDSTNDSWLLLLAPIYFLDSPLMV